MTHTRYKHDAEVIARIKKDRAPKGTEMSVEWTTPAERRMNARYVLQAASKARREGPFEHMDRLEMERRWSADPCELSEETQERTWIAVCKWMYRLSVAAVVWTAVVWLVTR